MEKARVSVGMPVRNDADGVLRAVPAILGQTWPGGVRLIVVDDASTDGTAHALAQLVATHEQLELITNVERHGSAHACNQVLEMAGDGYLAWADPRSVWLPRKLELQLAALLNEERRDPHVRVLCTAKVRTPVTRATPVKRATIVRPGGSGNATDLEPSTLLGKAEHFRAVTGFDLGAVGAREFLRRFAGQGGRLVSPPDDAPLATEVASLDARALTKSWRPRDVARGATKGVARAVGRAMPVLRRYGVVGLARRVGIVNALGANGAGRALYEEARVTADAVRTSQDGAVLAAKIERATDPAAFLHVEQQSRDAGLLHTAEVALRSGLERFPDDPALRVRLIELLPLRRKPSEAADRWVGRSEADKGLTGSLTHVRAARALRESGAAKEAAAVAAAAMQRWPSDWLVRDEARISRAALVEWEHSVTVAGDLVKGPGTIHDLGFLAGVDGPVTGTVSVPAGRRCRVSIVINGVPVATTDAASAADAAGREVSLRCDDALQYLGDGDVVTLECAGRPLSILGRGTRCEVTTGYESHFNELQERLREGNVFTKFGTLKRGHTPESKRQMLKLFGEVSQLLANAYGYRAFPLYGNLLGAIRGHDFIAHDVGGFDMGYVSAYASGPEVRQEFIDICRALLSHGYFLRVEPWSVYVRPTYRSRVHVDLNFAWFTEASELQVSGGWRFAPVTDVAHFRFPRTAPMYGQIVRVPGNAEEVLTQLYGPNWAVSDQGFGFDADLQRDSRFLLPLDEMLSLEQINPDRIEARIHEHPDFAEDRPAGEGPLRPTK